MRMCTRVAQLVCGAVLALCFCQTGMAQTGACCTSAGACSVTAPTACTGTSVYYGNGTVCTPNACQGACCSTTGGCTITQPGGCTGTNTYLGSGTVCTPTNPCTAFLGACCSNTGVCTAGQMPAACTGTNTFQGHGSTCSPSPCLPNALGPCCTPRGVCTLTLPIDCALPNTFGTVGTACTPTNPCTVPTGACCAADGTCAVKLASGTGSGACGGTAGDVYIGNDTTCSPNPCAALVGACCTTAGACVTRTGPGCAATAGQFFNGVGSLCSPSPCATGACCAANGNCSLTIASNCVTTAQNSPTFLGNGSACTPSNPCTAQLGACCPNGTAACTLTMASGCQTASFGVFNGVGSTCTPSDPCASQRGACCSGLGACTQTTGLGCNGNFRGVGTVCSPSPCQELTGACCSAVGGCTVTIGTGCTGANSFRGAGTVCDPTPCAALRGACCSAIGACTLTTQGGCIQTSTFQGAGTVCSPTPCTALLGACCTTLASCSITTAAGCTGTSTFRGAGTLCMPNDCTPTQGACCTPEGGCSLTTTLACTSPNLWSAGTSCNPGNPCFLAAGACCIGTFCTPNTAAQDCTSVGGAFFFNQPCSPTPCVRPAVSIAQFYPGGGTSGAVYNHDYVMLFNRGATPVDINNWSLQFGAQSTQTFPTRVILSGTIGAGRYFLIRLSTANASVGADLPVAPDLIAAQNMNLDVGGGRLALVSNTTPLPNGCPSPFPVNIVDFVGYGAAAGTGAPTCAEGGSPGGGTGGNIYAYTRKGGGCTDTDVNGADVILTAPAPRNSLFPPYICGSMAPGACCVGESCSVVADVAACNMLAGVFLDENTTCTPNPCEVPKGACCNGTTCTFVVQGACPAPNIFDFGRSCTPDPCTVACCTGNTCTITALGACVSPSYYIQNATCSPNPCVTPSVVQSGDIAYGASVAQPQDAVQQIRGAGSGAPTRVGTWTRFNNVQSMRFDNHAGILHNAEGNLLGVDFGSQAFGGAIYNLPTTTGDAAAGNVAFQFTGPNAPFGLQRSRFAGLSVSPNNDRLAVIGYDAARLIVMSYIPGAVGTGTGATVDGATQTDNNTFVFGFNITQGTAWLDNNNVIMWVQSDIASVLKLFTLPVSGSGPGITIGAPVERLAILDNKPNSSRFTSIAYNPQLVPGYLFLGSSAFQGVSLNTMYVVDISGPSWTLVKTVDLGTSLQTEREIAIGPDRNLYFSQFAGSGTQPGDPLIDRMILDADANGVVTPAEVAALTDNSSVNFYLKGSANTASFNGLDIAISLGACCNGPTCSLQPPNFCSGPNGTYLGNDTTCTPGACQGACCCGSTCTVTSAAACTGAFTTFAGVGVACNAPGNNTMPCCRGDYNHNNGLTPNVTVQDIFDFLAGYFSSNPCADFNGGGVSVQDIFDYLAAYFSGC